MACSPDGVYCVVACGEKIYIWQVSLNLLFQRMSKLRTLEKLYNKICHMKLLLSSFHLNDCTQGFYPQMKKLEPPSLYNVQTVPHESTAQ